MRRFVRIPSSGITNPLNQPTFFDLKLKTMREAFTNKKLKKVATFVKLATNSIFSKKVKIAETKKVKRIATQGVLLVG